MLRERRDWFGVVNNFGKVEHMYNIPKEDRELITMLYQQTASVIQIDNLISSPFKTSRGLHQAQRDEIKIQCFWIDSLGSKNEGSNFNI